MTYELDPVGLFCLAGWEVTVILHDVHFILVLR